MRPGGALLFTVGSLSWAVAQWLLILMIARLSQGAEAVGAYALVLSITTPVFTLAQLGLRTVYLSLGVVHPWRSYLLLRLAGVLVAFGILAGYFVISGKVDAGLWASVLVLKAADLYFDLLQAPIQRRNRLAQLGLLNIANSLGTILLAAVALWLTGSVTLAILASACVSTAVALGARRLAARSQLESTAERGGYREILRAGVPAALSDGLASLSIYLPIIVLSQIADESTIGVFSAAAYLITFANLSGAILKNVLLTQFRETNEKRGQRALLSASHSSAVVTGVVSLALAPVVILAGDPVLRLVYGNEFGMSHFELGLLAFAAAPIAASAIYSTALNVLNRFTGLTWNWVIVLLMASVAGIVAINVDAQPLTTALVVALVLGWARLLGTLVLASRTVRF